MNDRADIETAIGESFADAICPPVRFEDASPHECCEALRTCLGPVLTTAGLAGLSGAGRAALADAIGRYFEVPPPSVAQVEAAIAAALARWPAD